MTLNRNFVTGHHDRGSRPGDVSWSPAPEIPPKGTLMSRVSPPTRRGDHCAGCCHNRANGHRHRRAGSDRSDGGN